MRHVRSENQRVNRKHFSQFGGAGRREPDGMRAGREISRPTGA